MNKKLLALTLSGALAVSMLAGCGGSSNGGDTSTSTDTKADTTEASGAEGSVYYLNFKPEQDQQWQDLAKAYTEETGVPVTVVTAASEKTEEWLDKSVGLI